MTHLRLRYVQPEPERCFGLCSHRWQVEVLKKEASSNSDKIGWFLQGTLYVDTSIGPFPRLTLTARRYPDVIESLSFKGPSQTIKTHHNVVSRRKHAIMVLKLTAVFF